MADGSAHSVEADRIAALSRLRILDSGPEQAFDALTRLAAAITGAPMALVSLVDVDRQWFKSRFGLGVSETPRSQSFCHHAILHRDPFLVADAHYDLRFRNNPLVVGAPFIRSYLGVPLFDKNGHGLGTLCVIDRQPRNWRTIEVQQIDDLAKVAVELILSRATSLEAAEAAVEIDALAASRTQSDAILAALSEGVLMCDDNGRLIACNRAAEVVLDLSRDEILGVSAAKAAPTIIHEDGRPYLSDDMPLIEALKSGASVRDRLIGWKPKGGSTRWLRCNAEPVRDPDTGVITGAVATMHDVTARREAERAHAYTLDRLRDMERLAQIGVWEFDPKAESFWLSDGAQGVLQIQQAQCSIEDFARFMSAGCFTKLLSAAAVCLASGSPFMQEVLIRRADGSSGWARLTGARSNAGKTLRVVGSLQDVSERKEVELALQAATKEADEARCAAEHALASIAAYQAALDKHAIVAITDHKGVIEFVNDKFCSISGFSRQELVGQNHRILNSGTHPKEFFVDMWRAIGRGQSWHGEICNRTKDGDEYWVDTTIVPMLGAGGRPERFVSVRYDITARKRADKELQDALGQLAGFFDVSLDLLCLISLQGNFVRVNSAFEAVLGYSPEELVGRDLLALTHPDDRAFAQGWLDDLNRGVAAPNFVSRCLTAAGHYRYIEWRSTQANGLIYTAARDITDRLAYQKDLERAAAAADEANQAKSDFLANMSHEIRTPLHGMIGVAGALELTELDPAQKEMVQIIQSSGRTLERLVSDVLDISKIEAGHLVIEERPFDLVFELSSVIEMMRIRAEEKGLTFVAHFGERARGVFLGDSVRLKQVLSNLVSNAVKFTEKGGVRVYIEVLDPADEESAFLEIAVVDDGVGFDQSRAEALFTRFTQADVSITRRFGGTGLGLSISKALIDLMGGRITARSVLGEGSTFSVCVPLRRTVSLWDFDQQNNAMSVTAQSRKGVEGLCILVAEDHPTNRKVLEMILGPLGANLTIVDNGALALEAFKSQVFDLVLMDMQMPVMDGLAATRAIREFEAAVCAPSPTPIAMLTANALDRHVVQSIAAGADIHIAKPFTPHSLLASIEKVLGDTFITPPASLEGPEDQPCRGV